MLLFAGTSPAGTQEAQQEEEEHEPVESITIEETLPNRAGEFSLRLTADYQPIESEERARLPVVELNLGLTDFLDVAIEVPFLSVNGEQETFGLGDISTTFKWLLVKEQKHQPALVLGLETEFPTGSVRRELGEGAYELTPFVAALKSIGPVVIQGNVGWSRVVKSRSDEYEENIVFGVSVAVPLIGRALYSFAELSGSSAMYQNETAITVAPGLKWLWSDETFIAIAIPIPVNDRERGVGILAQFQWGF